MNRVVYSNRFPAVDAIVIAPKRLGRQFVGCVSIEDITKTPTWLSLNERIQENTPLCFVMSSSYYKVNSVKARCLERLAEISRNVTLFDVTPFCESIESLYVTWRYVDRSILGYQHYYAYAGGHAEQHGDKIVSSLDYDLSVAKIAPHCRIEKNPVRSKRHVIDCQYTASEHRAYQEARSHLFATKKTPQPIVTALSDLVHSFETRRNAVLSAITDDSVVITNLAGYAEHYRKHGLRAGTYAKPPDVCNANQIVFAEAPVVYTYRRLHIEMAAPHGCEIVDVRGDAKIDTFLGERTDQETGNVRKFCDKLIEVQT